MTKYVPTTEQRLAFGTDHGTRETFASIIGVISAGKLIKRALVRHYVAHDVDRTGVHDTTGIYYVEIVVADRTVRGYAEFAFNLVNDIPIAAEFRDFHQTISV